MPRFSCWLEESPDAVTVMNDNSSAEAVEAFCRGLDSVAAIPASRIVWVQCADWPPVRYGVRVQTKATYYVRFLDKFKEAE